MFKGIKKADWLRKICKKTDWLKYILVIVVSVVLFSLIPNHYIVIA